MSKKKLIVIIAFFLIVIGFFLNFIYRKDTYYLVLDEADLRVKVLETEKFRVFSHISEYVPTKYIILRDGYSLHVRFVKDQIRDELLFYIEATRNEKESLLVSWTGKTLPDKENEWVAGKKYLASTTLENYGLLFSEVDPHILIYQWRSFDKRKINEVNYLFLKVKDKDGNVLGQDNIPFKFKIYGWSWAFDGI